jgi:HAD superfamily hydrolase (TIGR01509 family)
LIEALVFDLDGTLVQTERLKAISYARAAVELCPYSLDEDRVLEAFKDVVGRSRREVAKSLVERFDLEDAARERMEEFGAGTPWQAFVQVRLQFYERMLSDPDTLTRNRWPHTLDMLNIARAWGCMTALATMSRRAQAHYVVDVLELNDSFDHIATRDDVERGKPDPEIYLLVSQELGVDPGPCLVLEDSPAGVQAAISARMQVVAVSTPFTRKQLHDLDIIPEGHLVDDSARLRAVVEGIMQESQDKTLSEQFDIVT